MDKEIVISLKNVSKYFSKELSLRSLLRISRGRTSVNDLILSNISLDINKGDFVVIVGNNGAGKSTLLKLISGVLSPDGGDIYTNGEINAIHELTSGFNQELNGYENLKLLATLQGIPKNEFLEKLEDVISFAELSNDSLNKAIKYYSSGMKTRLAYAFNIIFVKDILLLDEVLAVGDYNFIQKCIAQLKILTEKGVTIVLVTHNILRVETLITKIYEIANYKIKQTDLDTYNKYADQPIYTHPNLKINNIVVKGESFKLSVSEQMLNNMPEIKLYKNEKVNFEFDLYNSDKSCDVIFYAVLSASSIIVRYETVPYQLKNGKEILSFDAGFPELLKGKYVLNIYIFSIALKEIIFQNNFRIDAFSELKNGAIPTTPSIIYKNIHINV